MSATDRAVDPELLLAHAEGLQALARRLLRDAHRAEDVVQDAMLAAMRRPPPDGVPLGPWLVGIVRNLARMTRRGEARRAARERVPDPRRQDEPAVAAVARAETHRRLVDAVLALAEPYRATIVMRYLDGLSPSEIARRTGEPGATVRTRIHRGLALLRERLDVESRRDGRNWVASFLVLTRRPRLVVNPFAAAAACLLVGAVGVFEVRGAIGPTETAAATATAEAAAAPSKEIGRAANGAARGRPRRVRDAATQEDSATVTSDAAIVPSADAAPEAVGTGVSIDVVDEDGDHLHDGVVKLEPADVTQLANFGADKYLKHSGRLGDIAFGAVNPIVVADLPRELDGLELAASATVRGLAPTARVTFVVRAGHVETVQLVASRPRTAFIRVVERSTELPVSGASVVSETELRRLGVDMAAVRGRTGPGVSVTATDGTCLLGGLGGGEHDLVVEADGYARARRSWTEGEVRVRLERRPGEIVVKATVFGPDAKPAAGVGVRVYGTDRVMKTDASGHAVFEGVEAGFVAVSLDIEDWEAVRKAAGLPVSSGITSTNAVVEAGRTYEVSLGLAPGTARIDGRVVGEDGRPVAGVAVKLLGMSIMKSIDVSSDAEGRARFDALHGGRYAVRIGDVEGATWWAGRMEVADATCVQRSWTVGAHSISGRVVAGPDRAPVVGAAVYAGFKGGPTADEGDDGAGPHGASVKTGPDGRFEFRCARQGTYRLSVQHADGGARSERIAVPSDADVVLELVPNGRIAVRYLRGDRPVLLRAKLRLRTDDGEDAGNFVDGEGDHDLVSDGLVPGRYEVEVSVDGRTRRFTAEVRTGQTAVVDVAAP